MPKKYFKKKYAGKAGMKRKFKRYYRKKPAIVTLGLREPQVEVKAYDSTLAATAIGSTATFVLLNGGIFGTGMYNHVGSAIKMKSLDMRLNIGYNPGGSVASDDYIRVIIFYDKNPQFAAPALADVLQDVSQSGASFNDCFCGINETNRNRFVILWDQAFGSATLGSTATGAIISADQNLRNRGNERIFIKLHGAPTRYKSTGAGAGNITDISEGALFFMAIGQNAGTSIALQAAFRCRVKFTDC